MVTTAELTSTTMTLTTASSLTGLKPPGVLNKLTAEGWKKWKQLFEIYRIASGTNKMDDEVQVAVLLHCMGEACVDVYDTLELTVDEKKNMKQCLKSLKIILCRLKMKV